MSHQRRHTRTSKGGRKFLAGRKYSPTARKFIARKIKAGLIEGRSKKQAIAIAFSEARRKGYKVPRRT